MARLQLGHDLGLQPGGDDCDNFKPHYVSVMNYLDQTTGVPRDGAHYIDYARWAVAGFSEGQLDEATGFAPGPGASEAELAWMTPVNICAAGFVDRGNCNQESASMKWRQGSLAGPVDHDGSGVQESGVRAIDVGGDGIANRTYRAAINDWRSLKFGGYHDGVNVRVVAAPSPCPAPTEATP